MRADGHHGALGRPDGQPGRSGGRLRPELASKWRNRCIEVLCGCEIEKQFKVSTKATPPAWGLMATMGHPAAPMRPPVLLGPCRGQDPARRNGQECTRIAISIPYVLLWLGSHEPTTTQFAC